MQAVLLLGGNLGERETLLAQAREAIGQTCGPVLRVSRLYETPAWGFTQPVPDFLNQALMIETALLPEDLLRVCQDVELRLGRQREEKAAEALAEDVLEKEASRTYASRLIDIDILFYEDLVCQSPHLTIPHSKLPQRRFALMPLAEIASEWVHPQLGLTTAEMLAMCKD